MNRNPQWHMKRIFSGGHFDCACTCQKNETVGNVSNSVTAAASSTDEYSSSPAMTPGQDVNLNAFTRPDMATLHQMLQNGQWTDVQDAIQSDATVAMRIDDSPEEDKWFDEARRRKAAQMGMDLSSIRNDGEAFWGANKKTERPREKNGSDSVRDEDAPPMQLRYWVGNQSNLDTCMRAKVDIQQKRTLLHSLCRMNFPSNETLIVQLQHNDSEGLMNLMGAVKTARMLIGASHNCCIPLDDDEKKVDDNTDGVKMREGVSADCSAHVDGDCPRHFYCRYCPPVFLPQVEREQPAVLISTEDPEMILHTSVLTMTDSMGETPLHSLTGAGSCHDDLIKVFLEGCRPLGDVSSVQDSDRRPTVYDLLIAQNFHGCTPLHFLADSENEEDLRLLLEQCQFHNASQGVIHPTMVCDNEGDLPLHFASCNGASPSLLHTLTTVAQESSLVRNSLGHLPIDDFIECYMERLSDDDTSREISEGDNSSTIGSEEGSDGNEISSVSSYSLIEVSDVALDNVNPNEVGQPKHHFSNNFGFLSTTANWESELWDPIWVLIQAAATAIRNSVCGEQIIGENAWLPIHAAVIATKYARFPAMALAASVLRSDDGDADGDGGGTNDENRNPLSLRLLEEDSFGCLPLHLACGGEICSLLSAPATSPIASESMPGARTEGGADTTNNTPGETHGMIDPSTTKCKALVRWNTKELPCSMIEFLIQSEPSAARIPTRHGRLPLHLLAEEDSYDQAHVFIRDDENIRQPWDDAVAILKEHPDALVTPDVISHLYPFQVAAASLHPLPHNERQSYTSEPQSGLLSLDNTYRLIMEDPSLLFQLIEE